METGVVVWGERLRGGGRMQVIKTCVNVAVSNVPVQLLLGMQF